MLFIFPPKSSLRKEIEEDREIRLVYVTDGNLVFGTPAGGHGGGAEDQLVVRGEGLQLEVEGEQESRSGWSTGGSRGVSLHSKGGGPPATISSGPFIGRTAEGGTRDRIYGTTRYGSGYPYGGGSYISGRDFTFGYWPIYLPIGFGAGYYGYPEYGPATNRVGLEA